MKKRILLICIFICMLFLTACSGAKVTSNTKFNTDGSGTRTVTAYVKSSDIENMQGGFEELDQLLEDAAPEGVNLARTMQDNGDAIYQFSFSFSNIEEYNEKVALITGKSHNATWYTDKSIFKSNIKFHEEQCTYDLVKWATGAYSHSIYSELENLFSLYNMGENKVYYNDKLMYSTTDENEDPYFEVETAPIVNNVSVYTSFDLENQLRKTIILTFDPDNFSKLNTDLAKSMLDTYSDQFKIDLANHTIILTLNSEEEIREFFQKADSNYKKENFNYSIDNSSIFHFTFSFKENYNLEGFLSKFQLADEYVYNYLSIPQSIQYKKRNFYTQATLEKESGYNESGKYKYADSYTADFEALNEISIEDINVCYSIEEDKTGELNTTITINPNGCNIDASLINDYYKNFSDFVSVKENEDLFNIHFKKIIKLGMDEKENENTLIDMNNSSNNSLNKLDATAKKMKNSLKFEKIRGYILKKKCTLDSNFNINSYLPIGTKEPVNYEFIISEYAHLSTLQVGDTKYVLNKKQENSKDVLLSGYLQDHYYKINVKDSTLAPMHIQMNFTEKNSLLFIVSIFILFVSVVVALGFTIYDLKHEDEESISYNWNKRLTDFFMKIKKNK